MYATTYATANLVADMCGDGNCNGHGTCKSNGVCTCDSGWNGDSMCSINQCDTGSSTECSGHGTCNTVCECDTGYFGRLCAHAGTDPDATAAPTFIVRAAVDTSTNSLDLVRAQHNIVDGVSTTYSGRAAHDKFMGGNITQGAMMVSHLENLGTIGGSNEAFKDYTNHDVISADIINYAFMNDRCPNLSGPSLLFCRSNTYQCNLVDATNSPTPSPTPAPTPIPPPKPFVPPGTCLDFKMWDDWGDGFSDAMVRRHEDELGMGGLRATSSQ